MPEKIEWSELVGSKNKSSRPEIMEFVESFENEHQNKTDKDHLQTLACQAVAVFLLGPLEREEVQIYGEMIRQRVVKYRNSFQ